MRWKAGLGSEADVRVVPDLHAPALPDGPEELAGTMEAPADRGVRAPDDLCDLLAGEALDVAERQHGLVFRRQTVEGQVDAGPGFGPFPGFGGVARSRVGEPADP